MAIFSALDEMPGHEVYVHLEKSLGINLHPKCEGFTFASSVKMWAAVAMVSAAERIGLIGPGSTLVESSSGNLGIALSVVAAVRSMPFVCVTDPKCNPSTVKLIRLFGGDVITIDGFFHDVDRHQAPGQVTR
jgi:N-(2-amino-2-carboxyethyl)-L-glutamate synthase